MFSYTGEGVLLNGMCSLPIDACSYRGEFVLLQRRMYSHRMRHPRMCSLTIGTHAGHAHAEERQGPIGRAILPRKLCFKGRGAVRGSESK